MPRRRKRTRRKIDADYTIGERYHLRTGRCFWPIWPGFGDDRRRPFQRDEALAAWQALRSEMLAEFIARHPGYRPWSWWHLESRELRQRVDGGIHPCLADPSRESRYGLPRGVMGGIDDEWVALYESVPCYLKRLGLATKAELAFIADHPDLLEPVGACDGCGVEEAGIKDWLVSAAE